MRILSLLLNLLTLPAFGQTFGQTAAFRGASVPKSTAAAWTPKSATSATAVTWLVFDDYGSGGIVDRCGNYSFTNANFGAHSDYLPKTNVNSLNGHTTVTFTNDFTSSKWAYITNLNFNLDSSNGMSVSFVGNLFIANGSARYIYQCNVPTGGATARAYFDDRFLMNAGSYLITSAAGLANLTNTWAVFDQVWSATGNLYTNGVAARAAGDTGAQGLTNGLSIGAGPDGTAALLGGMAEIVFYRGILSAAERQSNYVYFKARYNLTGP